MLKEVFDELLTKVVVAAQAVYGERLVSIALYGSVARGMRRHDSDVDLLVVARDLPRRSLKRVEEFEAIEEAMAEDFRRGVSHEINTTLSPVLKTPEEVMAGNPVVWI